MIRNKIILNDRHKIIAELEDHFGIAEQIYIDNGPSFRCAILDEYLNQMPEKYDLQNITCKLEQLL